MGDHIEPWRTILDDMISLKTTWINMGPGGVTEFLIDLSVREGVREVN